MIKIKRRDTGTLLLRVDADTLAGANLAGADLEFADLRGAEMTGANLEGAHLAGASLKGARLVDANLRGADLTQANLRGAMLGRANLSHANMSGADLRNANLEQAYLRDVNLATANLACTDLAAVLIARTHSTKTIPTDTDVLSVTFSSGECWMVLGNEQEAMESDFRGACYNQQTRWPGWFDPQHHGAVRIERPSPLFFLLLATLVRVVTGATREWRQWPLIRPLHWRWAERMTQRDERRRLQWFERMESEIRVLPMQEAQRRAEVLLADSTHFACEEAPLTDEERLNIQPLPPLLRGFFEQYRTVHPVDEERGLVNDNHVSRWITPEHLGMVGQGFLPIGVEYGGHTRLAVKPGEETIYYSHEFPEPLDPDRTYPSIYHYLLATDRIRRP